MKTIDSNDRKTWVMYASNPKTNTKVILTTELRSNLDSVRNDLILHQKANWLSCSRRARRCS